MAVVTLVPVEAVTAVQVVVDMVVCLLPTPITVKVCQALPIAVVEVEVGQETPGPLVVLVTAVLVLLLFATKRLNWLLYNPNLQSILHQYRNSLEF